MEVIGFEIFFRKIERGENFTMHVEGKGECHFEKLSHLDYYLFINDRTSSRRTVPRSEMKNFISNLYSEIPKDNFKAF